MIRDKVALVSHVKRHLESDQIYIVGTSKKAVNFAKKCEKELNITGFLTDIKTNVKSININNRDIDVIQLNNFEQEKGKYIIIATNKYEYSNIYFSTHGCAAFYDYIWLEWYDIFMKNKKVILFEGNCQNDLIYYFMRALKPVTDNFEIMVYMTQLYKSRYAVLRWNYYLVMCDYYVTNNYMIDAPTTHSLEDLPVGCKIIKAPRVVFDVFWPEIQTNISSTFNDLLIKDKEYLSIKPHGPFDSGDDFVNNLIKSEVDDEKIIDAVLNYHVDDWTNMEEKYRKFFENLEEMEKECDIVYSPYLKENIKKKRCFNDPIHMSTEMNWYVTKQLIKLLELPEISESDIVGYDEFPMYLDHCTELPVYKEISNHFGLEWVDCQTKYKVTFYDELKELTFEEYYRAYVKALKLSMNLKKSI